MKKCFVYSVLLSTLFLASISNAVKAEDVILNSSSVRGSSSSLRLIRTDRTPESVKLDLPIAVSTNVCTEYQTRVVSGQNAARCGYDHVVRHVCVPVRECHSNPRTGRTECRDVGRRCYNEVHQIPRYCTWEETYCSRWEIKDSERLHSVTLKFKNMPVLSSNEQETFELQGRQRNIDSSEAVYTLTATDTVKPVQISERDGPMTGFKDVIIIKAEK